MISESGAFQPFVSLNMGSCSSFSCFTGIFRFIFTGNSSYLLFSWTQLWRYFRPQELLSSERASLDAKPRAVLSSGLFSLLISLKRRQRRRSSGGARKPTSRASLRPCMRWRSRSLLSSLRRFRSRAESAGFFRRPGPRRSDGTPARAVTSSLVHGRGVRPTAGSVLAAPDSCAARSCVGTHM